jgi:hypothetical protein
MTPTDYQPVSGSFADRVVEFFTTHPEEELTPTEIGIKFDKPPKNVHSLLRTPVEYGVLVRTESDDGELVYRLGKGSPAIKPNPSAHPVLPKTGAALLQATLAQGSKKHQVPRRRLPSNFDIDALQIEAGVPIPAQGNAKASVDWHRLFKRMKAGESVVLPRSAHGSLSKAKTDSKKTGGPELSIRLIDAEKLRLWRIK